MKLSIISEANDCSPQFKTLEKNKIDLSDDERKQVMKAKATWSFGKNGSPSPAIKKAEIRGKAYYYSNTHRCYMSASTLKRAIKDYFETVEPSA